MEKFYCTFENMVNYIINNQYICVPKFWPINIIENYRLLIETFGFVSFTHELNSGHCFIQCIVLRTQQNLTLI